MPVSARMAEWQKQLAVQKAAKPVAQVKARVRGLKKISIKPDLLDHVEFEPDNSRIGRESRGLQSCKLASNALMYGQLDLAAKLMVQEHCDLKLGITRLSAFIGLGLLTQPVVEYKLPVQTVCYFQYIQERKP